MTEHSYKFVINEDQAVIETMVNDWWDGLCMKEMGVIEDSRPHRFHCRYLQGYTSGEFTVQVRFEMKRIRAGTELQVFLLFPDFSAHDPHATFREIICWFAKLLDAKGIEFDMKPGLFQKRVVCE